MKMGEDRDLSLQFKFFLDISCFSAYTILQIIPNEGGEMSARGKVGLAIEALRPYNKGGQRQGSVLTTKSHLV